MRNVKISVPTPEQSEKAQELLFQLGCYWAGKKPKDIQAAHAEYLYTDSNKMLGWSMDDESYFYRHPNRHISIVTLIREINK